MGEQTPDTQRAARQLGQAGAFHYCPQFAFVDLCSLSLSYLSPATQLQLGLLRFALRHEPEWVWGHFDAPNHDGHPAPEAARELVEAAR